MACLICVLSSINTQGERKSKTSARHPSRRAKKPVSIRARYWAYLFENLRRAVDEIYTTCEGDANIMECKVVKWDMCRTESITCLLLWILLLCVRTFKRKFWWRPQVVYSNDNIRVVSGNVAGIRQLPTWLSCSNRLDQSAGKIREP